MNELIADANSGISNLIGNYHSMDPLEALREAYYLTAAFDLATCDSCSSLSYMLVDLATSGGGLVSQEILEAAIKMHPISQRSDSHLRQSNENSPTQSAKLLLRLLKQT